MMSRLEFRATAAIAGVFALRLSGLFVVYPVFTNYASHLRGATPALIGLALGAYGLTQGLLQIPFGLLSDRVGRKTIIAGGLLLFAAGSAIAALANSIGGIMIGRTLQGAGAVGSVLLALVADLTREEARTAAMAMVGMTIGLSFAAAIVLGPVLSGAIGVAGMLWLTALFGVLGIGVVYAVVPTPARIVRHHDAEAVPRLFARVIRDRDLLRLDFSIFALHLILTASFLAVPVLMTQALRLPAARDWLVYLPVLAASIVLMVPAIIAAEKLGRVKEVFLAAIVLLAASQTALAFWGTDAIVAVTALACFFTAFNIMEALLPSHVTKVAPADAKGTATGIYSSAQFLGIFVGGAGGGLAAAAAGTRGVFILALIVAAVWLVIASTMRQPGRYSSYLARTGDIDLSAIAELTGRLQRVPGVVEAVIAPDERVAYLKVDRSQFDASAVLRIVGP